MDWTRRFEMDSDSGLNASCAFPARECAPWNETKPQACRYVSCCPTDQSLCPTLTSPQDCIGCSRWQGESVWIHGTGSSQDVGGGGGGGRGFGTWSMVFIRLRGGQGGCRRSCSLVSFCFLLVCLDCLSVWIACLFGLLGLLLLLLVGLLWYFCAGIIHR
ncbi:hypothetical protein B0I35DRAFT_217962 [Stachybotrys elegans]|uniref:Uncharacterized protein n=1 Tax=Stachybotrys elegans TaxID=80388 RepID=A0A8K0WRM6_9HYPO|nr:hypothetical protein B0I35DRAFT_217962 [Stachybotrys elegans]